MNQFTRDILQKRGYVAGPDGELRRPDSHGGMTVSHAVPAAVIEKAARAKPEPKNPDDIRRHFPNATHFVANSDGPELRGERPEKPEGEDAPVRSELEPSPKRRALRKGRVKEEDTGRFLIRVTSVRKCLLDEDNLCEKYVVDCCRYAGLLPGDGPGKTKIEVAQRKAGKGETEHTLVEIYSLASPTPYTPNHDRD